MKYRISNEGFSLVEIMVALGISSAAALAFMSYQKETAKAEAVQKTKVALNVLEVQANESLKSRDTCNENMFKAFAGKTLTGATVEGNITHKKIVNKGYFNEKMELVQKPIFEVDTNYDAGRIWVADVGYRLENLQTITLNGSPWNRSATLKINVTFERCGTGGPVYREEEGKAKVRVCDNVVLQSKIFEKQAAFKVDDSGAILSTTGKSFDAQKQKWVKDPAAPQVPQAACADSQDALVEAANEYADKKICLLDAKMQAQLGREGKTSCDYTIKLVEDKAGGDNTSGTINFPLQAVNGSLKIKMIGGGGGGGAAKDDAGKGGGAGEFKETILPDTLIGAACTFVAGYRGAGAIYAGNKHNSGRDGGPSSITCPTVNNFSLAVIGGLGGKGNAHSTGGDDDGEAGAKSPYGPGAPSANGTGNSTSIPGAGGSGAGDDGNGQNGGTGGPGRVEVTWRYAKIFDQDNVELDVNGEPMTKAAATPAPQNNPAPQAPNYGGDGNYGGGKKIYEDSNSQIDNQDSKTQQQI